MNPPKSKSAGAATPRVPDYKPRDRLDPQWRPGVSVRAKTATRSVEEPEGPWIYSQRSLREHRRLLPAQRVMLGLLVATGVAAAGLVGLSMGGRDEDQRWSAPARQTGRDEGRGPPALRLASEPAPMPVDEPAAGPAVLESTDHLTATPSVREDRDAAGAQSGLAASGAASPESRPAQAPDASAGLRSATVLSVMPVLAEQAPAAVARAPDGAAAPAALSIGDDARRVRRPQPEARSAACSEAQQAMQLCGVAEGSRR